MKKDGKGRKKKKIPQSKPGEKSEEDLIRNPFDFGGLPDRDLKKNLGCG